MLASKLGTVLLNKCRMGSSAVLEQACAGTSKQGTPSQCGMQRALLCAACAARSQHPQGQMYRCTWLYTV